MKKYGLFILSLSFFLCGAVFFWKSNQGVPQEIMSTEMSSLAPPETASRLPNNVESVEELNNIIFSIKNKEDVEPSLKKIIEYAQANPANQAAQLYAVLAKPIPLFKGIAWRTRMLVEPIDAAYIATISWLRAIKRNNDRRAQHIDALFDYFTEPNPGENINGQTGLFNSMHEFQDYMARVVGPSVAWQIQQAQYILSKSRPQEALFTFDAALIFGAEVGPQMTSQTVRYRKFMPGHLQAMIANMHERLGFGYYLASYNLEGLSRFLNTLTAQSFVAKKSDFARGLIANVFDIHLQSPLEISQVLQKPEFVPFLTLRPDAVKNGYLQRSLQHLRSAADSRIEAFKAMQILARLPNQKDYFVNADFLTSRPAITLASLLKRQRLLAQNAPVSFSDRVTNSEFKLNISSLFNSNNPAIKDLKRLYPRPSDFRKVSEKTGRDPQTFKWNYEYGTADNWPDVTFAGLLPDTSSSSQYKERLISLSRDASTPAVQFWLRLFM